MCFRLSFTTVRDGCTRVHASNHLRTSSNVRIVLEHVAQLRIRCAMRGVSHMSFLVVRSTIAGHDVLSRERRAQ